MLLVVSLNEWIDAVNSSLLYFVYRERKRIANLLHKKKERLMEGLKSSVQTGFSSNH
ncbi:hypothetical protein Pint_34683 [Pistacia integerrima]|uniref:Uncharacterized protein n=1 Tax=Pistacia integerrima TaxID=434235 RepID=A0ACC0X5U3_9ROSI|nr:hypothetical protein Pint_34683 [Pistacia integerrima]